ncbi:hypothetical protein ABTD04_20890, partial [Acinetobacter baumannii]
DRPVGDQFALGGRIHPATGLLPTFGIDCAICEAFSGRRFAFFLDPNLLGALDKPIGVHAN